MAKEGSTFTEIWMFFKDWITSQDIVVILIVTIGIGIGIGIVYFFNKKGDSNQKKSKNPKIDHQDDRLENNKTSPRRWEGKTTSEEKIKTLKNENEAYKAYKDLNKRSIDILVKNEENNKNFNFNFKELIDSNKELIDSNTNSHEELMDSNINSHEELMDSNTNFYKELMDFNTNSHKELMDFNTNSHKELMDFYKELINLKQHKFVSSLEKDPCSKDSLKIGSEEIAVEEVTQKISEPNEYIADKKETSFKKIITNYSLVNSNAQKIANKLINSGVGFDIKKLNCNMERLYDVKCILQDKDTNIFKVEHLPQREANRTRIVALQSTKRKNKVLTITYIIPVGIIDRTMNSDIDIFYDFNSEGDFIKNIDKVAEGIYINHDKFLLLEKGNVS